MNKQFDIAPRRKRLGIIQKEVEQELQWPSACLGPIEDGRIGIDEETYEHIHRTIDRMEARNKETKGCDKKETAGVASAST